MMAGVGGSGKEAGEEGAAQTKSKREEIITDTSNAPPAATPLQAAMSVLATSIAQNADAAATRIELEAHR
jgi:hypothetical protein